ncbi:hypothetical protein ES707_21058 [subsurface metagenome]
MGLVAARIWASLDAHPEFVVVLDPDGAFSQQLHIDTAFGMRIIRGVVVNLAPHDAAFLGKTRREIEIIQQEHDGAFVRQSQAIRIDAEETPIGICLDTAGNPPFGDPESRGEIYGGIAVRDFDFGFYKFCRVIPGSCETGG